MSIPPTIPPPPDDQYEKSPRSRMAGFINGITGGGNARLNEIMAEDHARKMADLEMHRNSAHQYSQVLLSGISPQTGKALTDDEKTRYTLMQEQAQKQYEKVAGINPEAKDILGKLGTVVKHVMGKKGGGGGQGGQGGTPAGGAGGPAIPGPPGSTGAASAASAAAPPAPPTGSTPPFIPPGTASASPAKQGPELAQAGMPPASAQAAAAPPTALPPPQLSPLAVSQGAPIVGAQLGQQMELAKAQQSEKNTLAAQLASKQTGELQEPDIVRQQLEAVSKLPPEQRVPAMMRLGIIPTSLMHPVTKLVPNDPANPAAGAHYESFSPLQSMMGGEEPAGFVPSALLPTQKSGSSVYNADTGVTTTSSTSRKVAGGGSAKPSGRPAVIAAPPSGGGGSIARPAGGTAAPGGRLAAMADDWDNGVPPSKKDQPQLEKWMRDHGRQAPSVLTGPAQGVLMKTQPVLDQVNGLLKHIDELKLGDNNTRGYLFLPRLNYATGGASDEGSLGSDIAGLSLGSVVEAASALQGSSRSVQALKIALQHTPNAWVDSPKLIKEKLTTIQQRLNDIVDDANKYGRKNLPAAKAGASRPNVLPAPVMGAPRTAEEYLKSIHAQ